MGDVLLKSVPVDADSLSGLDRDLAILDEARARFKTDLFWAAKYGLGYDELDEDLHGDYCRRLQAVAFRALRCYTPEERERLLSEMRFLLSLLPRGHAKTTCQIALFCVLIANNPNIRMLLKSARLQNSVDILEETKTHFKGTAKGSHFRELFLHLCPPEDKELGTKYEFTTPGRTNHAVKEPTLLVSSAEQSVVTKHFDAKFNDDLVNEETTQTSERMDKSEDVFLKDLALLEPGAPELTTGTHWDYSDLHSRIRANENRRYAGYEIYVREISEAKCSKCNSWFKHLDHQECPECGSDKWTEQPIWPFRYTMASYLNGASPEYNSKGMEKESIPDMRERFGDYIFNCLYRNRPMDPEQARLDWDKIKVVGSKKIEGMAFAPFILIDTAAPDQGKKGAHFVITHVDAIYPDIMLIREIQRFRGEPDEFIDRVFEMFGRVHALTVGMEAVSYGMVYEWELNREMERRHVYMPMQTIKRQGGLNKTMRIRRLAPRIARQKLWIVEDCANLDAFREEVTHFPHFKQRDILDTLADAEQLMFAPENVGIVDEKEKVDNRSAIDIAAAAELESFGNREKVGYVHPFLGTEGRGRWEAGA